MGKTHHKNLDRYKKSRETKRAKCILYQEVSVGFKAQGGYDPGPYNNRTQRQLVQDIFQSPTRVPQKTSE